MSNRSNILFESSARQVSKKVLPGRLMLESGGSILVALFSLPPSPFHGVLALKTLSLFEVESCNHTYCV